MTDYPQDFFVDYAYGCIITFEKAVLYAFYKNLFPGLTFYNTVFRYLFSEFADKIAIAVISFFIISFKTDSLGGELHGQVYDRISMTANIPAVSIYEF